MIDSDVIAQVAYTLNGPIRPVGESNTDSVRLDNLRRLVEVIDVLLEEVRNVATYSDSPQASERDAGVYAQDFINDLEGRDE